MLPAGTSCPTAVSSNSPSIRSKPCMGKMIPETRLPGQTRQRTAFQHVPSSTLLGSGECGGEPVEGDGLAAQGAGAEDEGEHELQLVQDLVEGHPGVRAFGSALSMVQKAWARTARVTWRCQPVNERPSK